MRRKLELFKTANRQYMLVVELLIDGHKGSEIGKILVSIIDCPPDGEGKRPKVGEQTFFFDINQAKFDFNEFRQRTGYTDIERYKSYNGTERGLWIRRVENQSEYRVSIKTKKGEDESHLFFIVSHSAMRELAETVYTYCHFFQEATFWELWDAP